MLFIPSRIGLRPVGKLTDDFLYKLYTTKIQIPTHINNTNNVFWYESCQKLASTLSITNYRYEQVKSWTTLTEKIISKITENRRCCMQK